MKLYMESKGVIGNIDRERGIYFSRRTKRHYFINFNGFGISCNVLDALINDKIEHISIEFQGHNLNTTVSQFLVHGQDWTDGNDKQLILPIKYFNVPGRKVQLTL